MKSRIMPLAYGVIVLLLNTPFLMYARTLHIGTGYPWTSPNAMQGQVVAGDTVIIHAGSYTGTFFITNLTGTVSAPIVIKAAAGETVLFSGGTESFHFSDIAYVELQGIIAQSQSGNGMNIDDAGTFATPSHHILIKDCIFRSINATGNNDLLKLSGVDDFTVQNCIFLNGAGGGSGIDMVGCHRGLFQSNQFTNLGSNSIQIKGGSQDITVRQCRFTNGGLRGINIGGSTDLEFFRPQNATFEASRVQIYANVFEGSEAPFAFVGAVDCKVIHNTILRPGKWAMRILQETVDINRFQPCGRNTVQNNIFIITSAVSTEVNIGPDTAPGTFIYSNNLWYKEGQSNWSGPVLPVADPNMLIGNPGLNNSTFAITNSSIAYQKGKTGTGFNTDYYNKTYRNPPSIGAVEAESPLALKSDEINKSKSEEINNLTKLYPNPAGNIIHIDVPERAVYTIVNVQGNKLKTGSLIKGDNVIYIQDLRSGIYFAHLEFQYSKHIMKWIKVD
jgi:Right handed beta helix region/Secretion system C-terminal sorting domain